MGLVKSHMRFKLFAMLNVGIFLRLLKRLLLVLACLSEMSSWAQGQAPVPDQTKVIRIVVPFAPGGSNDIVGRALAQQMSALTKRNFVVENKAGAGGSVGTEWVARSEPDGTNLLLISSTFTMNTSIMKLRYDPAKAFVPVAMLGVGPSVIAVPAQAPWKNIRELIEDSKRRPGEIVFGSAGMASFQHFAIEWLMQKTGARFNVVHYKGGVPALIDLAAGHVQVSLGSLIQMQNFLKAGKIRLLAVAGPRRVTQIAQVPTLHESGYALEVHNWWGLLAPAGTSAEWIAQLHSDVNTVLSSAEMSQRLASEGAEVNPISRDDFSRMITEDMQRWSQVARSTGIRAE
jgi:tripartite-type tricarboxylate transporter receptor subunit TctC